MASTIHSITGEWKAWTPKSATGAIVGSYLSENRLYWGVPLAGSPPYVGFQGAAPPALDATINEIYTLGSLSLANQPVLGDALSTVQLELAVRFNSADGPVRRVSLDFAITTVDGGLLLRPTASLPVTLADDTDLSLVISGLTVELYSLPGGTTTASLLGSFSQTPFEDENCQDFVPFFHPDGCDVPAVCPIADLPIIENCAIPDGIEPIFDCPDLDLPVTSHFGWDQSGGGGGGGGGPPGPPGQDGRPGCRPRFRIAYSVQWVYYPWEVGVTAELHECPTTTGSDPTEPEDCCYLLVFTFYMLYSAPYNYECCPFLYCGGSWEPQDAELCYGISPPTGTGEPGELKYICNCDPTTTPAEETTLLDPDEYPCAKPNTRLVILICNSNASADNEFSVTLDGQALGTVTELQTDECESVVFVDNDFPQSFIDDGYLDYAIRAVHTVVTPDVAGDPCRCQGPTVKRADLAGAMGAALNHTLLLSSTNHVATPRWSYGKVYVFVVPIGNPESWVGGDAENGYIYMHCCKLLDSVYSNPDAESEEEYTIPYIFSTGPNSFCD